jgi:anti-sigma factor RsiW
VMSGAFMGGAVIVAVPLAIVMIGVAGFVDFNRRRKAAQTIHAHRAGSAEHEVEFTDRDQRTLVSE